MTQSPPAGQRIRLYSEADDRLLPVLAFDLRQSSGHIITLGDEGPGGEGAAFFAGQSAFLGRVFEEPADGQISILLRRQQPGMSFMEWERGLAFLRAIIAGRRDAPLRLLALTDDAASEFSRILGQTVSTLSFPPGPASRDDRLVVSVDESAGLIRWQKRMIEIDGWNWARLRRRVRFDLGSVQNPDLHDSCQYCNLSGLRGRGDGARSFLIVVPNGVGLGHLTRMIAVADEMSAQGAERIEFWCYSQGAAIIQAAGYPVHFRHTPKHLRCDVDDWHFWEVADLIATLRRLQPAAVIADGSVLDLTLIEAIRDPLCGAPDLVWVRRGMWNPLANSAPLGGAQYATKVLVPGDLAEERDHGPTARVDPDTQGLAQTIMTPPVTLTVGNAALPRAQARRALHLSRFSLRKTCVVSLGGDSFDVLAGLPRHISHAAQKAGVRLIWVRSPLASVPSGHIDQADIRNIYPLGRYLEAFDGAITAVGYNSFHELLGRTRYPVLLVPLSHQRLDSQTERARYAVDKGWARWIDPDHHASNQQELDQFFADIRAGVVCENRPRFANGAALMAQQILHADRDE